MNYRVLILQLLLSSAVFSQDAASLQAFENLPDNLKEELLGKLNSNEPQNPFPGREKKQFSASNESFIEDNAERKVRELNFEESKYFGYDYFVDSSENLLPLYDIPTFNNYELSYGDKLEVLYVGNRKEFFSLQIDLEGNLVIPEIGKISLLGLSLKDAERKLNEIISKTFVGTKALLSVSEASIKRISIIGMVKKPGSYLVNPYTTVSQAISYAGGLELGASLRSIKLINNNSEKKIDLYDFLINGNISEDISVKNGDVIVIQATNNFFELSGAVYRPYLYEYHEDDLFKDLLSFGMGLKEAASEERISISVREDDGTLVNEDFIRNKKINDINLKAIEVPSNATSENYFIKVVGDSVSNGYYKNVNTLGELVEKLDFSSNFYPFYFTIKSKSNNGTKITNLSLNFNNLESYSNLILNENTTIEFFSRESAVTELASNKRNLFDNLVLSDGNLDRQEPLPPIEKDDLSLDRGNLDLRFKKNNSGEQLSSDDVLDEVQETSKFNEQHLLLVNMGSRSFRLPVVGSFSPQDIYEFLDINLDLDITQTTVNSPSGLVPQAFEKSVIYEAGTTVVIPASKPQEVTVEIRGEVVYPGKYTMHISSTLNDLYEVAGGLRERADRRAIYLSRESIKAKEKVAYTAAKDLILDSVINNISSAAITDSSTFDLSILSIIDDANLDSFGGRISGNLSENSETSNNLVLEENDLIIVPPLSQTLSVTGEVLSPITLPFEIGKKVDYYVNKAGGFTKYADKKRIFILKADGTSIAYSEMRSSKYKFLPGDTIIVPRDLGKIPTIPLVSVATKIISDIAFAAASLNSIRN